MRVHGITIVVFLSVLAVATQKFEGAYSRSATPIWGSPRNSFSIKSPDGQKTITIERPADSDSDQTRKVRVEVNRKLYETNIGSLVNSETAWAPDSKAFFVTYSDGGNIGTYHVKVFYAGESGLHESEPIANGRHRFAPTCLTPVLPNVAAIKWLDDSSHLLVAVEVPPHSSCADMGTFRAYEVDLSDGNVLERYGQLRAKDLFSGDLGEDLMNADDDCIRHPHTCDPTGLRTGSGHSK